MGAIIALLADLTQGGIVPLRAKRRQAFFRHSDGLVSTRMVDSSFLETG
jgi:hypothetical protein